MDVFTLPFNKILGIGRDLGKRVAAVGAISRVEKRDTIAAQGVIGGTACDSHSTHECRWLERWLRIEETTR